MQAFIYLSTIHISSSLYLANKVLYKYRHIVFMCRFIQVLLLVHKEVFKSDMQQA